MPAARGGVNAAAGPHQPNQLHRRAMGRGCRLELRGPEPDDLFDGRQSSGRDTGADNDAGQFRQPDISSDDRERVVPLVSNLGLRLWSKPEPLLKHGGGAGTGSGRNQVGALLRPNIAAFLSVKNSFLIISRTR